MLEFFKMFAADTLFWNKKDTNFCEATKNAIFCRNHVSHLLESFEVILLNDECSNKHADEHKIFENDSIWNESGKSWSRNWSKIVKICTQDSLRSCRSEVRLPMFYAMKIEHSRQKNNKVLEYTLQPFNI